jgi:hypothetical protein
LVREKVYSRRTLTLPLPLTLLLFLLYNLQLAAVSNQFIIREILIDHPDFLYSDNIFEVRNQCDTYVNDLKG